MRTPSMKEIALGLSLASTTIAGCETAETEPERNVTSYYANCEELLQQARADVKTKTDAFQLDLHTLTLKYNERPELCDSFDSVFYECDNEGISPTSVRIEEFNDGERETPLQAFEVCVQRLTQEIANLDHITASLSRIQTDIAAITVIQENNIEPPQTRLNPDASSTSDARSSIDASDTPQSGSTFEGSN
jgi:hypothetical protein